MRQPQRWMSDLACERRRADTELPGVDFTRTQTGDLRREVLRITSEEGAKSIGRPIGTYLTLCLPDLEQPQESLLQDASCALAEEMRALLGGSTDSILVVGLGNRALTPDAIGALCADRVNATRQLAVEMPELFSALSCAQVSVLIPGVAGTGGIEAAQIVGAVCREIRPDAVIAVDALATDGSERLGKTFQLCDTGIFPGSGVANRRTALNRETLGVPVLGVGVPTVINSRVFLQEAHAARTSEAQDLFLVPRAIDSVVHNAARVLADAVNSAFGIP